MLRAGDVRLVVGESGLVLTPHKRPVQKQKRIKRTVPRFGLERVRACEYAGVGCICAGRREGCRVHVYRWAGGGVVLCLYTGGQEGGVGCMLVYR